MGYARWENLEEAIERARQSCESTEREPEKHLRDVTKMISLGNGATGKRRDWLRKIYLIALEGQTEQKLERGGVIGEQNAIHTHHEVGVAVRRTIEKLGGTMPEVLPPEPSIKKLLANRSQSPQSSTTK